MGRVQAPERDMTAVQGVMSPAPLEQAASRVGRWLRYRRDHDTMMAASDRVHQYVTTRGGRPVSIELRISDLWQLEKSVGYQPLGTKALQLMLHALTEYHDWLEWQEDNGVIDAYTTDEVDHVATTIIAYMEQLGDDVPEEYR